MNSSSPSSCSQSDSLHSQLLSQLATAIRERNRADCLISELKFLASMMKHDGVLHTNIAMISEKADAHIKRRWGQIEEQELSKNK
jgi:hypothetical protein